MSALWQDDVAGLSRSHYAHAQAVGGTAYRLSSRVCDPGTLSTEFRISGYLVRSRPELEKPTTIPLVAKGEKKQEHVRNPSGVRREVTTPQLVPHY